MMYTFLFNWMNINVLTGSIIMPSAQILMAQNVGPTIKLVRLRPPFQYGPCATERDVYGQLGDSPTARSWPMAPPMGCINILLDS